MWTESILKKFRIRIAGDEGTNDDQPADDPGKTNDDPGKNKTNNEGGEQDDPPEDDDDDEPDFDSLDEKTKKFIKKLRDENRTRRTENNKLSTRMEKFEKGMKAMFGDDDDDVDPEEALKSLQGEYESSVNENAILRLALENGVSGAENMEYFEFLMSKKLNSLEEGEEMTEEDLDEILEKCSKGAGKANTSTNDSGKGGKGPGKNSDEVTQEEFDKMGMVQKSKLYTSNPELYNKLMANSTMR